MIFGGVYYFLLRAANHVSIGRLFFPLRSTKWGSFYIVDDLYYFSQKILEKYAVFSSFDE